MRYTRIFLFFFNDTATTEIYTLSLHDALPILPFASTWLPGGAGGHLAGAAAWGAGVGALTASTGGGHPVASTRVPADRKSTRLNSSHSQISYAVFCLKKKTAGSDSQL